MQMHTKGTLTVNMHTNAHARVHTCTLAHMHKCIDAKVHRRTNAQMPRSRRIYTHARAHMSYIPYIPYSVVCCLLSVLPRILDDVLGVDALGVVENKVSEGA